MSSQNREIGKVTTDTGGGDLIARLLAGPQPDKHTGEIMEEADFCKGMSDLVERLRMNYVGYNDIPMGNGTLSRGHAGLGQTVKPVGLCEEAADEITRLRKIEAAAKELYQEEQNGYMHPFWKAFNAELRGRPLAERPC